MNKEYNKLVKELLSYESNSDDNIVMSPLSIWILLKLLEDASSGKTKQEIIDSITHGEEIKLNEKEYKQIMNVANAVFMKSHNSIKESFVKLLKEKHNGKVFITDDFVKDVNSWVSEKTKGMIDKIVDNNDCEFGIANAISFDAKWLEPYEDRDIEEEFHNKNGETVNISFMTGNEDYYLENENIVGFTKPYIHNKFSFVGILPKDEKEDLSNIAKDLDITDLYNNKTNKYNLYVEIPEFKVDSSFNLINYFTKKGINRIFTNDAEFTSITDNELVLSNLLHKAVIKVDRKGTKAAAASWAGLMTGCPVQSLSRRVILNRPFIYAIIHNNTGIPVFVGTVNNL